MPRWILSFLLAVNVAVAVAEDQVQMAIEAANNMGKQVRNAWTSPERLSRNVTRPVMTGQLPLRTLDGTTDFTAAISCPGSASLFQVIIQPGPTMDLNFIKVVYDADLNGTLDTSLDIPGPVSGICANGFVSCTPGTWDDCHWFTWSINGTSPSPLQVAPSSPGELGGCYCINSGCSQGNIMSMKDQVLLSLGGGISAALSIANPRFAATKVQIDGFTVSYFGQNVGACSVPEDAHGSSQPRPEDAFTNAALLQAMTESELASQGAITGSLYSTLYNSPARTNSLISTCTMERTAVLITELCAVQESETNNCQALASDPGCTLKKEVAYDINNNPVVTYDNYAPTGVTPLATCKEFDPGQFGSIDINQCIQDGNVVTDGGCQIQYTCQATSYLSNLEIWSCSLPPTGQTACGDIFDYQVCGKIDLGWNIPDDPCELITIGENVVRDYCPGHTGDITPDSGTLSHNSGNQQIRVYMKLENQERCNGWAGGQAVVYLRPANLHDICHDWWRIERTYVCQSSNGTTPDLSRADAVAESVTQNEDSWSYTDNGQTYNIGITMEENDNQCMKICKVRKAASEASARADATTADFRYSSGSILYLYKTCVDGQCPVSPGETLVRGCGCISDFNLAYGVMEALRQAAGDQVCSQE